MLSDRSYMRDSYPRTSRSALVWIISATVGGFLLSNVFERLFYGPRLSQSFTDFFALSLDGIKHGYIWQIVTYGFLHAPGNLLDVLFFCFNILCLYLLGRDIEALIGRKRFFWLYLGSMAIGGLLWLATNYRFGVGRAVGAWPGIAALFTLFACLNANQRVPLLIFFVFPVNLKPKYLLWAALTFDLLGYFLYEIRYGVSPFGYHSTHLGGMLGGYLYYRFVHEREWRTPDGLTEIELPKWMRKKQKAGATESPAFKVNLDREHLRAEVDRILDKINSDGFQSLTEEEKRLLDDAKDLLSRR
jgi:membrane associated rhomboid family serine protease